MKLLKHEGVIKILKKQYKMFEIIYFQKFNPSQPTFQLYPAFKSPPHTWISI